LLFSFFFPFLRDPLFSLFPSPDQAKKCGREGLQEYEDKITPFPSFPPRLLLPPLFSFSLQRTASAMKKQMDRLSRDLLFFLFFFFSPFPPAAGRSKMKRWWRKRRRSPLLSLPLPCPFPPSPFFSFSPPLRSVTALSASYWPGEETNSDTKNEHPPFLFPPFFFSFFSPSFHCHCSAKRAILRAGPSFSPPLFDDYLLPLFPLFFFQNGL